MGLLGDLIDDAFEAPKKIVRGTIGLAADAVSETLSLPFLLVDAAIKAGCQTEEEIERFCRKHMEG